jgi:hypothetical protein
VAQIRWCWRWYDGHTAVARNSLRRSRILNQLRRIHRQHPALKFTVKRGEFFIEAWFVDTNDLLIFALIWPPTCPVWEKFDDIS